MNMEKSEYSIILFLKLLLELFQETYAISLCDSTDANRTIFICSSL